MLASSIDHIEEADIQRLFSIRKPLHSSSLDGAGDSDECRLEDRRSVGLRRCHRVDECGRYASGPTIGDGGDTGSLGHCSLHQPWCSSFKKQMD
jgi:hypothetical protein